MQSQSATTQTDAGSVGASCLAGQRGRAKVLQRVGANAMAMEMSGDSKQLHFTDH